MKRLKTGDIIYCHKPCIMDDYSISTRVGKSYTIIEVLETIFYIIDDQEETHSYSEYDYEQWFYNPRQTRKLKLDKIINNIKD